MDDLKNHLANFSRRQLPQYQLKQKLLVALEQVLGLKLKQSDLRISGHVVYVMASPIQKSEIKLKKTTILASLNSGTTFPLNDLI